MTRGIKNNNPGNIRKSGSVWQGKIIPSSDPDFEEFDNAIDGIRALAKIILKYYKSYGLSTITGIISRYAPGSENDTAAYIADVALRTGFDKDTDLNIGDPQILASIVSAIIWHENGQNPYSDIQISEATELAIA